MYQPLHTDVEGDARIIRVRFPADRSATIGYQIFDPVSGMFIREGEWQAVESEQAEVSVALPRERGHYHVYVSLVEQAEGWAYQRGRPFILLDAVVEAGRATLLRARVTTLRALRRRSLLTGARKVFVWPIEAIWSNRSLIRSMTRRDILARYRGSFGDILWTIINPVLLMTTYFFVFGVVLQSRFGPDASRTGFALYFLAGMIPWLGFSEAVGRSPHVMLEHRNFIKKLVFPVEILPVTHVVSGLVTQMFALGIFILGLFIARGEVPGSAIWLPLLVVPQVLFTLGITWFLAALGVYVRDLSQVMGFLLTLWFFLTPICYPEASLPSEAAAILTKNPIYVLVRGYRAIFLENQPPPPISLIKLTALSMLVFFAGYAWFHKLRKSFADVI